MRSPDGPRSKPSTRCVVPKERGSESLRAHLTKGDVVPKVREFEPPRPKASYGKGMHSSNGGGIRVLETYGLIQ